MLFSVHSICGRHTPLSGNKGHRVVPFLTIERTYVCSSNEKPGAILNRECHGLNPGPLLNDGTGDRSQRVDASSKQKLRLPVGGTDDIAGGR
jgi:hypothetical protein